jgi:hypothetical protein
VGIFLSPRPALPIPSRRKIVKFQYLVGKYDFRLVVNFVTNAILSFFHRGFFGICKNYSFVFDMNFIEFHGFKKLSEQCDPPNTYPLSRRLLVSFFASLFVLLAGTRRASGQVSVIADVREKYNFRH